MHPLAWGHVYKIKMRDELLGKVALLFLQDTKKTKLRAT